MVHNEQHTPEFVLLEEAITGLFCEIDDAYRHLDPDAHRYESLKKLSDSEVITLVLFQRLPGIESERSFLREAERFLSHLFSGGGRFASYLVAPPGAQAEALPGALRGAPHRARAGGRTRDLNRRFDVARSAASASSRPVGGLRRSRVGEVGKFQRLGGEAADDACYQPATHIPYELSAADVAEVNLTEELLAEAGFWATGGSSPKAFGGLGLHRGAELEEESAGSGIVLATERAEDRRPGTRQQIEVCFSSLKRVFGLGERLGTTLVWGWRGG